MANRYRAAGWHRFNSYPEVQTFVQDCLTAFLIMPELFPPGDPNWIKPKG